MTGKAWALVLSCAIGCIALGNYLSAARIAAETSEHAPSASLPGVTAEPLLHPAQADLEQAGSASSAADGRVAVADSASTAQLNSADALAKLIADSADEDAATRATAINALAALPKAQAIPILQKVLNAGTDEDRQLALHSLQTLAARQGDNDGEIRDVLRLTTYDGDDSIASRAQNTLEEIEHDIERETPARSQ